MKARPGLLVVALTALLTGCVSPLTVSTAPAADPAPPEPLPAVAQRSETFAAVPILMDGKGLSPRLQAAWDRALADGKAAGVPIKLNSGYRTPAEQRQIFANRVRQYGSERAAHKWALYPHESMHVRGLAIDVGPPVGAAWLEKNQATYGVCRVYRHEPWHFELNRSGEPCPPLRQSETEG